MDIDGRADADDVWMMINRLIAVGRIVAPATVLNELRENPLYNAHLRPHERALTAGVRDDPTYLLHVGRITRAFPGMSKARGTKTPADPFVVALAEMESYVVVCDESRVRRNRKIPGVCDQRGVRCVTLEEFIALVRG